MSIYTATAKAFSAAATIIVHAAAAVGAAAGGPGEWLNTRKCFPGRSGRRPRRPVRNACGVDRAVIDQWLMWRH